MTILLVVNNPRNWPLQIPEVVVTSARSYLTDPAYSEDRTAKVFNLCRSYAYQSSGYYVSLLAAARGHKPLGSEIAICYPCPVGRNGGTNPVSFQAA